MDSQLQHYLQYQKDQKQLSDLMAKRILVNSCINCMASEYLENSAQLSLCTTFVMFMVFLPLNFNLITCHTEDDVNKTASCSRDILESQSRVLTVSLQAEKNS